MVSPDENERFTRALQAGARAWRLVLERQLKACGLTPAGWSAIAALADMGQAPSQTELAQQLGVDSATLVATIDRLAAAGLIARNPSPHDRRVKLVVLTQQGEELARKVRAQAEALRHGALARLDRGQVAAAAALLEQLQQVLESA